MSIYFGNGLGDTFVGEEEIPSHLNPDLYTGSALPKHPYLVQRVPYKNTSAIRARRALKKRLAMERLRRAARAARRRSGGAVYVKGYGDDYDPYTGSAVYVKGYGYVPGYAYGYIPGYGYGYYGNGKFKNLFNAGKKFAKNKLLPGVKKVAKTALEGAVNAFF